MNKQEVIKALKEKGVEFDPTLTKAKLEELLTAEPVVETVAEGATEPAVNTEPPAADEFTVELPAATMKELEEKGTITVNSASMVVADEPSILDKYIQKDGTYHIEAKHFHEMIASLMMRRGNAYQGPSIITKIQEMFHIEDYNEARTFSGKMLDQVRIGR